MFQPFDFMKLQYLQRFKVAGKRYLVSQTYERGRNEILAEGKEPILMSHYDDKGLAEIHYKAIPQTDRYRFILDLENETHRKKIEEMMLPESKYVVYAKLIAYKPDAMEKVMKDKYYDNMSRYITTSTKWNLGRNKFATNLEVIFGELFIIIKLHNEKVRVPFAEIEKS